MRISAGEYARQNAVVSFPFENRTSTAWVATTPDGDRFPVQISDDGTASFIYPGVLAAGASAELLLQPIREAPPHRPWVEVLPETGRLRLSVGGTPALYYQAEKRPFPRANLNPRVKRGAFLHPVITPSGKVVSQSYAKDHEHHHGIWTAWTRTRFRNRTVDYWNLQGGAGKVEFDEVENTWSGPVHGGFVAKHRFVDLTGDSPRTALLETWKVTVFQIGTTDRPYRLFELEILQEPPDGEAPMILPQYYYGGLGFRGPDAWLGAGKAFFLTSEGETNRLKGNGTRARWTHVGGLVQGERAGLAILGHPNNFRAPQPVRLHPNEPFFCFAPSQLGEWTITREHPYRARYRFVVADGEPDPERIERLWNDFAHPVEVGFPD